MSTTFEMRKGKHCVTVAFRHNGGRIEVINELLLFVNKNRRVYSVDNTPQGIYFVKDILEKVKDETYIFGS